MPAKIKPKPTEAANDPRAEWRGMPECVNEDRRPIQTILVHFAKPEDVQAFAAMIGREMGPQTKSTWYPPIAKRSFSGRAYIRES